ncbi:reverse transcriptase domain-containing protein [Tanacetum coccineum]|uniref:Reverse transcriptase domain-containing protein n=1 Tax=Tanacetum coccineum TaxID=301880 RepID=A0ABQ4XSG7_9ASTR
MPPRMTIRSTGWATAAPQGGRTGGRTGRGGGRTEGRSGDQGDSRNDGQGGQATKVEFKGMVGIKMAMPPMTTSGVMLGNDCAVVVCVGTDTPYLLNGYGVLGKSSLFFFVEESIIYGVSLMRIQRILQSQAMIEKMESVQDMSGCRDSHKVKYSAGSFVGKALTWWNSQIHTRGREATIGMSWEDFKTLTREEFCPNNEMQKLVPHLVTPKGKRIEMYLAGTLTDEALRNGSIKKNPEKRENGGEPKKDRKVRDDNKRTRTGNAFATTTNPVGRENTVTVDKCTTYSTYHPPRVLCRNCFKCNCPGHFAKDCRDVPRNVNPVNARNPTARACYVCGSTD